MRFLFDNKIRVTVTHRGLPYRGTREEKEKKEKEMREKEKQKDRESKRDLE